MRVPLRFLPAALILALPGVAWAEGNAVVLPMVASGVDSKVGPNLTSLLSSELDFSGAFDTVNDIPAPPTLNAACLTSTKCLAGIAKDNDADALVAGTVTSGSAGLKVSLVLYDAAKNAVVRKKSFDIASDVASVAGAAPKMAKELTGEGSTAAAEEEAGPGAAAFEDEEDFAFDKSSDVKGKTKFTPETKKGKLVDVADEEDDERAAEAAAAAAAKRRSEEEARLKAVARARAAAEAAAAAEAEKAAKARAEAEAKAKAKAVAEAKAKAEAEARAEAEAEAKAAAARKKTAPVEEPSDEDLEAELAAFSFGGGGKVAAEVEVAEEPEEEEAEEEAPRSFSERYKSSASTSKPSTSSSKTTASRPRVVEPEEEEEEELEEEEEAPRSTARTSTSRRVEEEEDEEDVAPTRARSRVEEEEDEPRSSRTVAKSSRELDEEDEEERPRARTSSRLDDDEDEPVRRSGNEDARARFGVAARGGYARYGSLDFVTYGAELDIPVSARVVLLLGVEGASTNRNYTDEERAVIANAAGILPEQVQDWNAILPINVGIVYKVPTTRIQPYIGVDGLAVAYTAAPDFAFGGRLRGGCDFMVSDNFGFNIDAGLGVLSGDQFDLIQAGLADTGFYPEISGGTVLSF